MTKRVLPVIAALLIVFSAGTIIAFAADENPAITAGQVHEGDYTAGTGSRTVTVDGTVTGDLMSISQDLTVNGTVEGDILSIALEMNIGGNVGGSVRAAGTTIVVSSKISRNLMAYGSTTVNKETVVSKNAYLYGNKIKCLGTVEGITDINGTYVTLGGTYRGNVTVHEMGENSTFEILPGTVIDGKLTYEGVNQYSLPAGVTVKEFEYVKTNPQNSNPTTRFAAMEIVKKIITLLAYYLFALLLYKLFPKFFTRSGDFIRQKPLSAAGIGIASLGTFVGSLLLLLILFFLGMIILNMSVFAFTGLALTFAGVVTLAFAQLPVSLWLGGIIAGRGSVPARLATGLAVISVVKFVLDYFGQLSAIGSLFGIMGFLLKVVIWLLGTGAILKTVFAIFKSANRQAEAEEMEMQELMNSDS